MKQPYNSATIAAIKAEAKRQFGKHGIRHIRPRAYCVAKTADWCAAFVIPSCDAEEWVADKKACLIQNKSAESVSIGDWCSLAYVSTSCGSGENRVILNLSKP